MSVPQTYTNTHQYHYTNLHTNSQCLQYCQFQTLTLTLINNAVKICTVISPLFTVMSVPNTQSNQHQHRCTNLHSHRVHCLRYCQFHTLTLTLTNPALSICTVTSPHFTVLSVPHTHISPHQHRCNNLHCYQPTIKSTVISTHSH
jgi:hypothetical protein